MIAMLRRFIYGPLRDSSALSTAGGARHDLLPARQLSGGRVAYSALTCQRARPRLPAHIWGLPWRRRRAASTDTPSTLLALLPHEAKARAEAAQRGRRGRCSSATESTTSQRPTRYG